MQTILFKRIFISTQKSECLALYDHSPRLLKA